MVFHTKYYRMKITEGLIERFLNNECDEWETQAVREHLIQHPQLLQKYLTHKSWIEFRNRKALPADVSEKMLHAVRTQTYGHKKAFIIRYKWASAAAVFLLVLAASLYMRMEKPSSSLVPVKKINNDPVQHYSYETKRNNTSKTILYSLTDGSKVEVWPNSEIRYTVPFEGKKRDIYLKGQALFSVAKDSSRPFTVFAGKLATTALGTVFKITAFENAGAVMRVHLLSGKVKVEPDSVLKRKGKVTEFLVPGQELSIDPSDHILVINKTDINKRRRIPTVALQKNKPRDQEVLSFHDEALESIFRTLGEKFRINFSFRNELIADMRFTGKFDSSKESLIGFVQTIGLLNNLDVRQEKGVIHISAP
jgi:transmembrane sensor